MATGVVYYHRFYMFHSFKEFPRYVSFYTQGNLKQEYAVAAIFLLYLKDELYLWILLLLSLPSSFIQRVCLSGTDLNHTQLSYCSVKMRKGNFTHIARNCRLAKKEGHMVKSLSFLLQNEGLSLQLFFQKSVCSKV